MKCIACDTWEAVHDGGLCDLCKAEGMPDWYDLRRELVAAGEYEAALREAYKHLENTNAYYERVMREKGTHLRGDLGNELTRVLQLVGVTLGYLPLEGDSQ